MLIVHRESDTRHNRGQSRTKRTAAEFISTIVPRVSNTLSQLLALSSVWYRSLKCYFPNPDQLLKYHSSSLEVPKSVLDVQFKQGSHLLVSRWLFMVFYHQCNQIRLIWFFSSGLLDLHLQVIVWNFV